jgi:hypothetical protein
MFGVVGRGKPYALKWSARSVSMLIRRTLRMAGRDLAQERRRPTPRRPRGTRQRRQTAGEVRRETDVTAGS